jgi:AcrR family transcriptional regulator
MRQGSVSRARTRPKPVKKTATIAGAKRSAKLPPRRKNLRAPEREKVILESAIRFFAEHGFEGQTRELAKRIGIAHSAIYRHYPSKEALIERVYQHVYLGGWQKHWAGLIKDRSHTLEARLTQFYCEYSDQIFNYDWVRIFIFSGLKSFDINSRYLAIVMEQIGIPALTEARHEFSLPSAELIPITPRERELFWGLHGRFFYIAIRKFVYGMPVPEGTDRYAIIADDVRQFVSGSRSILEEIVARK